MMKQYHSIKKNYRDTILLFRLGDFYEMFEEDAVEASSILNITLTRRNAVKMCGFPYHAADSYISKLLKSGKRVAICEQVEDPKLAKGIVKRRVVEILSPGIITKPELLNLTDK
ncbi:MAG: DNA mismatch repair protein MutS, partial [Spirochaetes bacterium]